MIPQTNDTDDIDFINYSTANASVVAIEYSPL